MSIFSSTEVYSIKKSTEGIRTSHNGIKKSQISILLLKGDYDDASIDFLKNILKAIGFNLETDCIVREFKSGDLISINKVISQDNCKYILSFGIDKNKINTQANIKMYKWNHFDSFSMILSNKLDDIKNNVNLKRSLWVELKNIFNDEK